MSSWPICYRGPCRPRCEFVDAYGSDWEPEDSPVPDDTLDSQLMEGITNLEHSAPGVSLDSGPMEGMLCLEPSEQSIPNSFFIARPVEGVAEKVSDHKPVINLVKDSTPDGQLMEGITYLEHSALGVSLDSRKGCHVQIISSSQCSEQGRSCDQKRWICQSTIMNRHVLNGRRGQRR